MTHLRLLSPSLVVVGLAWVGCSSDDTFSSPAPSPGEDAGADVALDRAEDREPTEADIDAGLDAPLDPRFQAIAAQMETERVSLGAPGAAAAIIQGGMVTWSAGFGSKNPDANDPVHDTTLFRMGSVNKMLTATRLLQLVEQGDVDLDAPVTTYLPTLSFTRDASWAPSITVKNLLTHTSGIHEYIEIDSSLRGDDALSNYMLGAFADQQYLMAPPGRFFNYTNPGYMFAGLLTETLAGQPYRIDLKTNVFDPLGMSRTMFLPSEVIADGDYALAKTVHWETGAPLVVHPDTYDNGWARPAGYAWSSVLDLAKFVTFLAQGNPAVLSDALRAEMMSPQVNTEEAVELVHYGYGIGSTNGVFLGTPFYPMTVLSHSGGLSGFAADLYYVPHCDLGFVTLASTDHANFLETLITVLTTLCELPTPATPPDLSVDPNSFDDFVGDYEDQYNAGLVTLSRVGAELRISMPLLDQMSIPYEPVLEPTRPRNFVLTIQGVGLPLTMILDANGKGEYIRTRPFVAVRTPIPSPTPTPGAFTPDVASLLRIIRAAPAERLPLELLRRP